MSALHSEFLHRHGSLIDPAEFFASIPRNFPQAGGTLWHPRSRRTAPLDDSVIDVVVVPMAAMSITGPVRGTRFAPSMLAEAAASATKATGGWRFEVPDGTVAELLLRRLMLFGVARGNRGGP